MLDANTNFGFQVPQPAVSPFDNRQVQDNYNQDKLHRFRGTLARLRRRALLSEDPRELSAYLQLARSLNIDPSMSNTGRAADRGGRAENKFRQDTQNAQLFQSPITWLL